MKAIAYLANSFPEPGEPYVGEEIRALRNQGQRVIACSFRRPRQISPAANEFADETRYVLPLNVKHALLASLFLLTNMHRVYDLIWRVFYGREPIRKKLRSVVHAFLGACLAARLQDQNVEHVHVHHGYFASWAGLVCARILGSSYSLTLHGSDLLIRGDYLDCKLQNARFCMTISQFNREYILNRYPSAETSKIRVHRLGVDANFWRPISERRNSKFTIVSVGRMHAVKNYEFLIRACHILKLCGVKIRCVIAGDGKERATLEQLISSMDLQHEVEFPGHIAREQLPQLYAQADIVVFTSESEGIPVAAMEAMAMERVVLAPAITGIPELIEDGHSGLLYRPKSMNDFLAKLEQVRSRPGTNHELGRAARRKVQAHFDHTRNLELFTVDFLHPIGRPTDDCALTNANPVLQQI